MGAYFDDFISFFLKSHENENFHRIIKNEEQGGRFKQPPEPPLDPSLILSCNK